MKRNELKDLLRRIRDNTGKKPDWYLHEGDKVRINVDWVMSHPDFNRLRPEYQQFIRNNRDTIFTVHVYREKGDEFAHLIELVEFPKWLFVESDLIKVKNGG